jgi:glycosyltransferase involved in cell wall biosynthesis
MCNGDIAAGSVSRRGNAVDHSSNSNPAPAESPALSDDGKLHVLYLNHAAQVSGAEMSLRSLLQQFRRSDAPVDPVLALPDGGLYAGMMRDEGFCVTLAPLRRLHRPHGLIDTMSSVLHVLQTTPYITRLVQQTHSQLVHSNSTTAHLVGCLAAERLGRPSIWHARDLTSLGPIAGQLAARSSKVIAISACVAEHLIKDGVPEQKIAIIYNGLDPDEWRVRKDSSLRATLALPEDSFLFGMVGQLIPWKNHAAFIEAAGQLAQEEGMANARFAIIGGDLWSEHKGYVQELRELVKQHHLTDRFNFIPNQNDAVDALSAVDCLVHPTHSEPFGRVIMEAMALGKPVIAMAENGPREIIVHETDGLLVPSDAEHGLAEAMKRIYQDAALREHLSANSRTSIEARFHIADSANRVLDLYRQLVG